MVSSAYLDGRKKWSRPQAMIWSNEKFTISGGGYIPGESLVEGVDFIVLSDHNRAEINMNPQRIESRNRMIDGSSRGFYTADKETLSTSWANLPGRIASEVVAFDPVTGAMTTTGEQYVVDGGMGALEMRSWYDTHIDFWVYLSYDQGPSEEDPSGNITKYSRELHMYFSQFETTMQKRGRYDFWNVNVGLEEV